MSETDQAAKKVRAYLAELAKSNGLDQDQIHGFHTGHEREALLTRADLETLIAAGEALGVLAAEIERLREIFPKILAALGNGAACQPDASAEFLAEIPDEVGAEIEQLRAKNARLRDIVSRFLGMFHDRPADDGTGGVRWKPEVTTLFDDAQAAVQESK